VPLPGFDRKTANRTNYQLGLGRPTSYKTANQQQLSNPRSRTSAKAPQYRPRRDMGQSFNIVTGGRVVVCCGLTVVSGAWRCLASRPMQTMTLGCTLTQGKNMVELRSALFLGYARRSCVVVSQQLVCVVVGGSCSLGCRGADIARPLPVVYNAQHRLQHYLWKARTKGIVVWCSAAGLHVRGSRSPVATSAIRSSTKKGQCGEASAAHPGCGEASYIQVACM